METEKSNWKSNGKSNGFQVQGRIVRLKLIDGSLVNGQVNINRNPGYDRLSDLVGNPEDPFLVLFNVTLYDSTADNPSRHKTLFVNKTHIIWAEPDEDQK